MISLLFSNKYKPIEKIRRENNGVWPIMRPFAIVVAKITLPKGLSIRSGRRAPMIRYFGFIIAFSRGTKIPSTKIYPT